MPRSRRWTLVAAILIAIGIVLRLRAYQLDLSLWLDEASLAINLIKRDFGGLASQLSYYQAAPLLFLWFEKLVLVVSHSTSEYALRFIPVLAGCASCVLFWPLCRSFGLNRVATALATGLFCFSVQLINYSSQAKQYSTDAFMSVAIYLAVARFLRARTMTNTAIYGAVGLLGIGISHPSIFILGAAGIAILIDGWRRKDREELAAQSALLAIWLAGFTIDYLLFLRHMGNIPGMREYWHTHEHAFMPLAGGALHWLRRALSQLISMAGGMNGIPFMMAAAIAGAVTLWRKDWRQPTMLILPVVFAIGASAARQYPFAQRMLLFLLPTVYLLAGAGFGIDFGARNRVVRPVLLVVFCYCAFAAVTGGVARFTHKERFGYQEFRDTFLEAAASGRCTDHMFVYQSSATPFRYYNRFRWAERYRTPLVFLSQMGGEPGDTTPRMSGYLADASDHDTAYFDNPPCFWLVAVYPDDPDLVVANRLLSARAYQETKSIHHIGAGAYLYQLKQ